MGLRDVLPAPERMLGRAAAVLIGAASLSAVFGTGIASAAPGSLVSSFGTSGTVVQQFGLGSPPVSEGGGVAVAGNGDIYQVGSADQPGGSSTTELYVARFLPNGALDPSFGNGGVTYETVAGATSTADQSGPLGGYGYVALTPSGNPVVLTDAYAGSMEAAVFEFTQSGALDTSFNAGGPQPGVYTTQIQGDLTVPGGLAVQSNGQIVLTGAFRPGSSDQFFAERLNSDGSVDGSFGSGGVVTPSLGQGSYSDGTAVIAQSNGDLVFSAIARDAANDDEFAILRLTSSGQPDPSFNGSGAAYVQLSSGTYAASEPVALAATSDGGYAVAGESDDSYGNAALAVARFTGAGQLDTSFGSGGAYVVPQNGPSMSNSVSVATAVFTESDGKLILSGAGGSFSSSIEPVVIRLNPDGTLDAGFGSGGSAYTPTPFALSVPFSAAETPDGNLVLSGVGQQGFAPPSSSFLQEVSLDTPPTVSFAYAPSSVQAGTPVQFVASAVAGPGESISQVSWDFGDGNFADGTGTGVSHTFTAAGTYTVRVRATDAFGLSTISTQSITVAAAPVTVTPQIKKARPTLRVISVRDVHGKIKVKLSCKGAACKIAANLTTLEHLISGKTASLSSAGHGKHTKTVKISAAKLKLAAGKTRTFTLKLNRTGKRLLATFHHIPAKGSFKLTNTRPAKTIHRTLRIS